MFKIDFDDYNIRTSFIDHLKIDWSVCLVIYGSVILKSQTLKNVFSFTSETLSRLSQVKL